MDATPGVLEDKDMTGVWAQGKGSTEGNQSNGSDDLKRNLIWRDFIHLFFGIFRMCKLISFRSFKKKIIFSGKAFRRKGLFSRCVPLSS